MLTKSDLIAVVNDNLLSTDVEIVDAVIDTIIAKSDSLRTVEEMERVKAGDQ